MNPSWRSPLATSLAVAIAYFAVGQLALLLAIPPGYASPLYPAAGLALAALLSLGQRHVVGIALGSISVNLILGHQRGVDSLLAPVLIGCGAALQAWVAAWAVRRWVPLTSLAR